MDRKNALRLMAGTSLGALLPTGLWDQSRQRPNILFIMTDDHDEDAISAYGGDLVETPNLDRLAEEGMRFDNCYVTNSLCAPSRATILTGKYSHKNGVKTNIYANFDGTQQTVQGLLQEAGYYTAMVGKWHLKSTPTNFDYWIRLPGQGRYFDPRFYEKGKDGLQTIEGYATDIINDLTMDTIDKAQNTDKPFFIMSHHKASHAPFNPARRHSKNYDNRKAPLPESIYDDYEGKSRTAKERSVWGPSHETRREKYQDFMNPYLETVMGIDENIGRLMDYLDRNNLRENTLVIYTTDNGYFLGDHGYLDKRISYEDALQIPLIVRYPPEIPAGSVNNDIVLNLDFPETFLDYAEAEVPGDMQGRSLRPLLKGEQVTGWRNSMYFHFYEVDFGGVEPHYGVRTERYKLLYFYPLAADENPWELYDLEKDPYEMDNVYGDSAYSDVQAMMKQELKRVREFYDDNTGEDVPQSTDIKDRSGTPEEISLHQNYPNPFNPTTRIKFNFPTAQKVTLTVHNSMGREIKTLVNGIVSAGRHTVQFDGGGLANGVYYYRLKTETGKTLTRKMVLMK